MLALEVEFGDAESDEPFPRLLRVSTLHLRFQYGRAARESVIRIVELIDRSTDIALQLCRCLIPVVDLRVGVSKRRGKAR